MGRRKIEEIKERVRRFKEGVAKKFFVEKVFIFGSAVRENMKKDSDIDIIVISKKYGRKDTFKITPKLYGEWHEKQKINYPVDIILFNTEEFEKLKKGITIVREAVENGIEV